MTMRTKTTAVCSAGRGMILVAGLFWSGLLSVGLAGPRNALDQLGYNPADGRIEAGVADARIRGGIAFAEARLAGLETSVEATLLLDEAMACLSGLELKELYLVLPYAQAQWDWRGIGVRGAWSNTTYSLGLDDPDIPTWLEAYDEGSAVAWGRQQRFGDFGALLFMRPISRKQVHLFFQSQFHTGRLPPGNIVRTECALLDAACDHLAASRPRPSAPVELDRVIVDWLAADFPHLHAALSTYVRCEQWVESVLPDGSVVFHLRATADVEAFDEPYPALARLMRRGRRITSTRSRVVDDHGNVILESSQRWGSSFTEIRFRTRNGIILPLRPDTGGEGFSPLNPTPREFELVSDFRIRSLGARLTVSGVRSRLRYHFSDAGPSLVLELTDAPDEISSGGLVLGIIPVWLIDFVLPSNLEDITGEFIRILAEGRDGEGMSVRVGRIDGKGLHNNFWVIADTDIASNGFMKFGFGLFRKLAGGERSVSPELRAWAAELAEAFKKDIEQWYRGDEGPGRERP